MSDDPRDPDYWISWREALRDLVLATIALVVIWLVLVAAIATMG